MMDDYISRQAAIDAMAELQGRASTKAELKGISKAWKRIKKLPSVQPTYTDEEIQKMQDLHQAEIEKAFELGQEDARAEIIHCGECKHWREDTAFSFCDKLCGMGVLDALDYMTAEDDYCSMAEREDDETD